MGDITGMSGAVLAQGQQRNKNKPLDTNAKAYRRSEEERAHRSMLESKGLDPDHPSNAKKPYTYQAWPKAMYSESEKGEPLSCLVNSQEEWDQRVSKGWQGKPLPVKEQISEVDQLRRDIANLKAAQADQNELSELRKTVAELQKQVGKGKHGKDAA
jgi:hypothetical protein